MCPHFNKSKENTHASSIRVQIKKNDQETLYESIGRKLRVHLLPTINAIQCQPQLRIFRTTCVCIGQINGVLFPNVGEISKRKTALRLISRKYNRRVKSVCKPQVGHIVSHVQQTNLAIKQKPKQANPRLRRGESPSVA